MASAREHTSKLRRSTTPKRVRERSRPVKAAGADDGATREPCEETERAASLRFAMFASAWKSHDRPRYTHVAHGRPGGASPTGGRGGVTARWLDGHNPDLAQRGPPMRLDVVRMPLMLL